MFSWKTQQYYLRERVFEFRRFPWILINTLMGCSVAPTECDKVAVHLQLARIQWKYLIFFFIFIHYFFTTWDPCTVLLYSKRIRSDREHYGTYNLISGVLLQCQYCLFISLPWLFRLLPQLYHFVQYRVAHATVK